MKEPSKAVRQCMDWFARDHGIDPGQLIHVPREETTGLDYGDFTCGVIDPDGDWWVVPKTLN